MAIIASIVVVIIGLAYFTAKPILNNLQLGLDLRGGLHVVLMADEKEGQEVTTDTIQKAIGVLRNRIDSLGVKEPIIYPQGKNRIVIELAGVNDPEQAVNIIKNTAQLEFRDESGKILVTGKDLKDAQASPGTGGQGPSVNLEFNAEGTKLFAAATAANVGKRIAIVIDDQVISAPNVNGVIPSGQAEISGGFADAEEAQNLAVLLRSGALPVSFSIMEKRTVGPTLGLDSLNLSVKAAVVGLIAILLFMIGYYLLPGLVASISMVLYSILVLGTMASLGSVLTLPGIAGFVLSIGMAVDANIIIYEHIKEELRFGKTLKAAIEAGFARAFWTIFDSNLTTLIAAVVLIWFGTGPIKGFAVTLSIGIVASMLVALTFTRYLLVLCADITKKNKLYGV
ncbi:MAG: protein translocase subunit SecD [Firmicutes bacterium HGW-Firmicutes-15]|nr:MAG: protein translocase subunit SecD [Firmicutes bacterium HGW-Firmicutes-15]